ncbi:HNH endonuclease family protein [Streptomyces sp. NPDC058620]|uniref:HNH endonuclease family protein n=1 Tax=Streptomyces sp. NPDC058620 TaxID=3346560 RepID=UPI00364BB7B8
MSHPKHGDVPNLPSFLASASALPLYSISRPLTRFLLLAAYHDTLEDQENPGLIIQGKAGVASCFTADGWADETHLTIEHITPQQATGGWDQEFYSQKETVHKLGNLVLAPGAANTSLSSRPWTEKRVLYAALGAPTADDSKSILNGSGLTFAQTTEDLAAMSRYLPHLRALGQREDEWDPMFMDQRAEVLLRLAYTRLKGWLGLELSDSSGDQVVKVDDLEIENDELDESEDAGGGVGTV